MCGRFSFCGKWRHLCLLFLCGCFTGITATGQPAALQEPFSMPVPVFDSGELVRMFHAGKKFLIRDTQARVLVRPGINGIADSYGAQPAVTSLRDFSRVTGALISGIEGYPQAALRGAPQAQIGAQVAAVCKIIGHAYNVQGNYEKAAYFYYKAISVAEQTADSQMLGETYNGLALLLFHMGAEKRALYYLDKAEVIARRQRNNELLSLLLNNKGLCYSSRQEWIRSASCHLAALKLAQQYRLQTVKHNALVNLGGLYLARDMPAQALAYLLAARSLQEQIRINVYNRNSVLVYLGKTYLRLNDYRKAEPLLLQAAQAARQYHITDDLLTSHKLLSAVYAANGRCMQALYHQQQYARLNDSLTREKMADNVNRLEVKYRTSQKDRELVEKKLQITRQEQYIEKKNRWIWGITGAALVSVILSVLLYRNYRHKQKLQQERIQNLQQEKEIGQLRAMMKGEEKERTRIARELHDGVGGMLASIKLNLGSVRGEYQELPQIGRLDAILSMLEDAAAEVRKTAHNLMPDMLIRHSLAEALVIYCDSISTGSPLELDLQFHGDLRGLDKAAELILYRIAQELIQNIIKHAHASYAVVQIRQHEEKLSIMVEDNGTGFDTDGHHGGFGLQNLQYRVQALQGTLSIMSAKGRSTTIYIEFGLEKLKLADG